MIYSNKVVLNYISLTQIKTCVRWDQLLMKFLKTCKDRLEAFDLLKTCTISFSTSISDGLNCS